ncbi:MAG TPA: alpha/beta fold hydrolase [Azospira sp.]|nr:alpha/beta fold hydrolase [Azospira sp.]
MPPKSPPRGEVAVLLLHGLYSNPNEMSPLGKELEKSGYHVHIPHLPGYSVCADDVLNRDFASRPWEAWYAQVEAEFDELRRHYRQVAVGGLCIGADLALHLAAQRGLQVAAVLALATTLYYDGWGIPWYSFLLPLGYYTPLRHVYTYRERFPFGLKNPRVRARVEKDMREKEISAAGASQLPLNGIYQAQRLIGAIKKELHQVVSPTLVIHSREDDVASLRSARHVYRHVSAEHRRQVVLDDSYHIITLDNERRRVSAETLGFLAQALGQPTFPPLPKAA